MATFCTQCGAPLRENARFCAKCGAAVPAPPQTAAVCAYCGGTLKATSKFCPRCGQTVGAAAPFAPQYPKQVPAAKPKRTGLFYANIALAAVCVGLIVLGVFTIPQKKGESPSVQPGSVLAGDYGEGDYDDDSAGIAADYEAIARGETLLPAAEESASDFTPHAFSDWASDGEEG